ncbi:MAG TPA: ATP-binding cassette domain-containing protein [Gaiellaceae bacterium]|nr:ATP-binding cassette domain-containing protein [Gaiellaceae bacterium]
MCDNGTLAATEITVARGAETILEDVTLTVTPGSRIGVVGPNGRGKTTLLRALAGLEQVDAGSVRRSPPGLRIGYLPEERESDPGETVGGYIGRRSGEREDWRIRRALAEAGLDLPLARPVAGLSGGQSARVALASILAARFDVYLLDEPTNDLDFPGLALLERFLGSVDASVVVVSHDRAFLDRTVRRIVELEAGTQRVHEYAGGWAEYEEARARARAEHERAYAEWEGERDRFTRLRRDRRAQARAHGKGAGRRGTHALMSKTRAAAKRLERLDEQRVEKPWQPWELQLSLAPARRAGDLVVALERAVVERDGFRLGPLDLHVSSGERISIAGPNGSGKSTLLAALVGRLPLAEGERRVGPSAVVGEIGQLRERFGSDRPLIDAFLDVTAIPADDARTLLAKFDLYAEHVVRPGRTLSPGERTRGELAAQSALGVNCLVLDEPTNHLDLPAIEELERALARYEGTLLLVTHDRRFLERVGVTRTYSPS